MTTQPSPALSGYRRSARSLGAKSALSLATGATALLSASPAHAQAVATQLTTGNVVMFGGIRNLFIDFDAIGTSGILVDHNQLESGDAHFILDTSSSYDHVFSLVEGLGNNKIASNGIIARNLAASVPVDSSLFNSVRDGYFNLYSGNADAQWQNATGGFIGVKFLSSVDNANHYGWLKVSTNADASEVTLLAFGYNQTAGASILTGEGLAPVPEPATSAALLALGAAGLVAYRKRKNLQRAA